ncbi:hypothetical protein ACRAWG_33290 [Methylobacterium sp. P31]
MGRESRCCHPDAEGKSILSVHGCSVPTEGLFARGVMQTETAEDDDLIAVDVPSIRRKLSIAGLCSRIALASAVIAALCYYAHQPVEGPAAADTERPFVPAIAAAPAPPAAPVAQFGLAAPGLDPVQEAAARIDPLTGQREDTLTRGAFDQLETPTLRVTLTRGASAGGASSLFVLMARRAAMGPAFDRPALSVVRTGSSGQVQTKFGAVETLDVTLSGAIRRTCTGFVTRETVFRIDGWLCAPLGRPPEARMLGCMIDALGLVDLADPDATAAFSAPARAGPGCTPATTVADATGRTGSIGPRRQAKNKATVWQIAQARLFLRNNSLAQASYRQRRRTVKLRSP